MTIIAFTHTGAETYEQMVEMGLEVQPVHAGMSRFAHPDEAWDLYWRPPSSWSRPDGSVAPWRRINVGDQFEFEVGP
jgi:hypothetical protein